MAEKDKLDLRIEAIKLKMQHERWERIFRTLDGRTHSENGWIQLLVDCALDPEHVDRDRLKKCGIDAEQVLPRRKGEQG